MKVQTSRFGEFEIKDSAIIEIVGGIIGFPAFTRFVLLEYSLPFSWLHSVDNQELAFVVVNAAEFGDSYNIPLPFGDRTIELQNTDDVAIMNLVSVRPDPSMTTVNLKAPVIVNLRNMRGRQLVLDDPKFSIRFPLFTQEQEDKPETQK